jgi:DNA-3-methyladenine glycosylase II
MTAPLERPRDRARTFVFAPIPPFRLDLTVWALRRRPRNRIDRWDGTTYSRTIAVAGRMTEVAVRQRGAGEAPRLIVTATPSPETPLDCRHLRMTIDRLLGLRIDLTEWHRLTDRQPRLRRLAHAFRGMKPPRFPSMFEAVMNGFACQQLSLEVGLELLNRLAILCADNAGGRSGLPDAFPTPDDVARLPAAALSAIGFSGQKTRAILDLAGAIASGSLDLESLAREEDATVRERLLELRGVGRWTAEYVLLRGLGRLDVFPGDDVGAQKRLARWLGRPGPLDYAGVARAAARWQPYAGMVYFHLLLDGLSRTGAVIAGPTSEPPSVTRARRSPRASRRRRRAGSRQDR